jgi:hypothetical protein
MLFLASSCLQGQPLARSVLSLLRLRPDGIQLCPGHHPSEGLRELLAQTTIPLRYHHGFTWTAYRSDPWTAPPTRPDWSLHPPEAIPADWRGWLATHREHVLEVMPPGRLLGCGAHIEAAMDLGMRLAVDIAHLHILSTQGALPAAIRRRLLDYEHIAEVHLSESDGRYDLHRPITGQTPLLSWARARMAAGVVGVLECYMHRLSDDQRTRQLEAIR